MVNLKMIESKLDEKIASLRATLNKLGTSLTEDVTN